MRLVPSFAFVLMSAAQFVAATAAPPLCGGTFRLAARPIMVNKQSLNTAMIAKTAVREQCQTSRIALTSPDFSPAAVARYGWRVVSRQGGVVTLRGPATLAPYLGAIDGIGYVKKPSRVFPLMDTVRKYCGVDVLHRTLPGPFERAYTGKGVLFGIIDTDFDVHHPAFADSLGTTRFVALWDQNDSSGASQNRFGYGTIKHRDALLADSLFGLRNIHHGTTMASYAVGGQRTTPFYGVAPDALIAGVCMGDLDDGIIDGLRWLFSLADSLDMPCVVNMSLGYHDGPHDGTSLVDRAIDSLSGPGRIVVGAAGNDGDKQAHVTLPAGPADTSGTWARGLVQSDTAGNESAGYGIEMWGEMGRPFSVTVLLLDTATNRYLQGAPVLTTDSTITYEPDTLVLRTAGRRDIVIVEALTEKASTLNGKPHVQVRFSTNRGSILPGIRVTARATTAVQAWNMTKQAFFSRSMPKFLAGDTIMSVNELGGTARSNITVGAYTSKLKYTLYNGSVKDWGGEDLPWHFLCGYSSHGPTADGRIKPDITAPGSDLIGAMPRDASGGSIIIWPDTSNTIGRYWASGGTSASAPVVAGTIALMLEVDATLTPKRAKEYIQATAITDATTGPISEPNIIWGAGRLNSQGALARLLGMGVRQRTTTKSHARNYALVPASPDRYRLVGGSAGDVMVRVLSLSGRTMYCGTPEKNGMIALPPLPHGVFVLQASRNNVPLCAIRIMTRFTQLR